MTSLPPASAAAHRPTREFRGRIDLPTDRPDVAPVVQVAATQADFAQRTIERDTAQRLGIEIPDAGRVPVLPSKADKQRLALDMPNRKSLGEGPMRLPIGTTLRLSANQDDEPFIVTGLAGDEVQLARPNPDGTIERTTSTVGRLAEREVTLAPAGFKDAQGGAWYLWAAPEDESRDAYTAVAEDGRDARVVIVPQSAIRTTWNEHGVWDAEVHDKRQRMTTTWGDYLDATGVAKHGARLLAPGAFELANLRTLVGDRTFVLDELAENVRPGTARLTATDSIPDAAKSVIKDADDTATWFKKTTGIDVWNDPETYLLLRTNSPSGLANASAGRSADTAILTEGAREHKVRATLVGTEHGEYGQSVRKTAKIIRDTDLGVRSHEAGHAAMTKMWGSKHAVLNGTTSPAREFEYGVVHEAMADLFGTARSGTANMGIRDADRTTNRSSSLASLRTFLGSDDAEVHEGTQILTKPMIDEVAKRHGWERMGEIGGAAIHQVARELAEVPEPVTIPQMAAALRDATAARFGAESETVLALERAWGKLGVLTPETSPSAREQVDRAMAQRLEVGA